MLHWDGKAIYPMRRVKALMSQADFCLQSSSISFTKWHKSSHPKGCLQFWMSEKNMAMLYAFKRRKMPEISTSRWVSSDLRVRHSLMVILFKSREKFLHITQYLLIPLGLHIYIVDTSISLPCMSFTTSRMLQERSIIMIHSLQQRSPCASLRSLLANVACQW